MKKIYLIKLNKSSIRLKNYLTKLKNPLTIDIFEQNSIIKDNHVQLRKI